MSRKYLLWKRALRSVLLVLLLNVVRTTSASAQSNPPTGAINGLFSVSENSQVYFSQGNLQYQASTNTWRFAENQWDYVGNDELGTVYESGLKCDNSLMSSSYNGWIDLFGWGTSGHDHGAVCYQPWSTSGSNSDYYAYGNGQANLYDQTGKADWGSNAISNGGSQLNQWRTLTREEWVYVFGSRPTTSGIRYAKAKLNDVNGILLLPDDWDASYYTLNNTNNGGASFNSNTITVSQWNNLEQYGVVFLPAAGRCYGTSIENGFGGYWSSSCHNNECAYDVYFPDGGLEPQGSGGGKCFCESVRLVRPAQINTSYSIEAVPNPTVGGTITGAGTYDYYAQVTLTATANEGYTFYQWKENGNVISTENSISFVALFDRNLEACFLENSTYPLFYSYNEGDHTATVIGHWDGQNATGDLVIPETVMHNGEAYTVTTINGAFSGCSELTSVVIPNSVITIGHMSFCDCVGLTSVSLGNSVSSIVWQAFWRCQSLTSIEFPNSLTSIEWNAFGECFGLTDIVIPSSVTSIGDNPFRKCSNLTHITVEPGNAYYDSRDNCNAIIETATNKLVTGGLNTIIPNTVNSIGRDAFNEIPISSITIPASVNYIGDAGISFNNTLLSMTVLAEMPPTLDGCPFCGTDNLTSVFVPCSSIEVYQNTNGWNKFTNFIGNEPCSGMVTVTANHDEYGTVSGGGYFENSETCTVTATPNEGYYFLCWMENGQGVSTEATYTFPVYRDHDLTAIFYSTLGEEKVVNGDFEQGNVGFTTACAYNSNLFGEGTYYIDNDANMHHSNFVGHGHGGTGNFMIVNGAINPETNIWTEQITVMPNAYYVFSTWVCTVADGSPALLQFSVNGTQIGDIFTAPSQTNTWQQFYVLWYSGNSTSAAITILNQNTEGIGNDFGLDDISFREFDSPWPGEITVAASPTEYGTVSGGGSFEGGETCTVTATPNEGYIFVNWTENGQVVSTEASYSFYVSGNRDLVAHFSLYGIIAFADSNVKAISVQHWDTNGDGELSYAEAAAVTALDDAFHGHPITSFDEFQYFTGVTVIEDLAFDYNRNLVSITLPNSVTSIGYSFRNCENLGSFYLPESVISINHAAFESCRHMEQIVVAENNPVYDSREDCNAIIETATNKMIIACKNMFIPNTVTTTESTAFVGIDLISLYIPSSVTNFGGFIWCPIEQIVVDEGNPVYDSRDNCNAIVETSTNKLVKGCKNTVIPDGINIIGGGAFIDCNALTSITIPTTINSIEIWAFRNNGLTTMTVFAETPPYLDPWNSPFGGVNHDIPVFVPYGTLETYQNAEGWNEFTNYHEMTYITIPGYGEGEGNYRFIASPLVENANPATVDNMITETSYDLYRFDQSEDDEWRNYKANTEDFVLQNGQGYLYANAEDVNLVFKGEFNEDDTKEVGLVYDVNADFAGWNLVGNPFPVNAYANKSYYTMNEEGTAIEPNMVSLATAIPACTGVMVMAKAEGETVVFSTEAPEAATNQGCLQIELSQAVELVETPTRKQDGPSTGSVTALDKAILSFNAGDRLEKFVFNKENAVISIPQGGKELSIACTDKQGEMPLNFKATKNGEYILTINPEAVELDYLHLIDNLTGADVDLLVSPAYTFTAKTTDYASRFRLVFSGNEADGPSTSSGTFAFINNGNIIITDGPSTGSGACILQIVDVMGRIIVSTDAARNVSTCGIVPGVYVLRLINGDDVKTQKIVIE
jgi:hypothetical protein